MLRADLRWKFGVPPAGNANHGWIQYFIHHLAPLRVEEGPAMWLESAGNAEIEPPDRSRGTQTHENRTVVESASEDRSITRAEYPMVRDISNPRLRS
jgi:hypothetical protein